MKARRWRHPFVLVPLILISVSLLFAATVQNRAAYRFINVFQEVWARTVSSYVEPVNESDLLEGAFRGMVSSLDAASAYLAPGEEKILANPPGPGRPGLEVLVSSGGPVIVRIDPGGPAEQAKLQVFDQIWKVGGKSARQLSWPVAKRILSGPVGGKLDLVVLDGRTFKFREVSVSLESPRGPGFKIRRQDQVLYLQILDVEFLDTVALNRELAEKLAEAPRLPLLIDLRGVVGLDPPLLSKLAGVFTPPGPAFELVQRDGTKEVLLSPAGKRLNPAALFVLADGTTAGVGEALAASLKESAGARIIGRTTYGLGGVPELIRLSKGGHLLLTTREMRTPGGLHWSDKGLEPDKILTPPVQRQQSEKNDVLLEEAIRWIKAGAVLDPPTTPRKAAALGHPRGRRGWPKPPSDAIQIAG